MREDPLPLAYAPPAPPCGPAWYVTVPAGVAVGGVLTVALVFGLLPEIPAMRLPVSRDAAVAVLFPYAVAATKAFGGRSWLPDLVGFGQYPVYFGAVGLGVSRRRAGRAAAWVGGVHAVGFALRLLAWRAGWG